MNTKSKAILAYVVIFFVGGASGFFLHDALNPRLVSDRFERGPRMNSEIPPPGQTEIPQRIQEFFIDRLELRDDQIEPYFEIQAEHMQKVFSVLRENNRSERDTLRRMHSEFVEEIDEILTSEQVQRLNRFAHPDSVRHRRMERRHRGWR